MNSNLRLPGTIFLLLFTASVFAQSPTITLQKGLPADTTQTVLYGNGIYLAVFVYPVRFFTSPDAVTWTAVTGPDFGRSDSLRPALAFGNGVFVCTGDSGKIFTSDDGSVWTHRSSSVTANLHDVQFLQGAFYSVGDGAVLLHSVNGIDWDQLSTGVGTSTAVYTNITHGNDYFVLTSIEPATGKVFYRSGAGSPAGWTSIPLAPTFRIIKFVKDRFFAFGDNVAIATDGADWVDISHLNHDMIYLITNGFSDGTTVYLQAPDGVLFTSVDDSIFTPHYAIGRLLTGGGYWNNTYFLYGAAGIRIASDGLSYQPIGVNYNALASDGHGYLATGNVAENGYVYRSTDFTTWTRSAPFLSIDLYSIVYDSSRYIMGGSDGTNAFVITTTDGISYNYIGPEIIRNETTPYMTGIAYGGGHYAGMSFQGLSWSDDGAIWHYSSYAATEPGLTRIDHLKYVNGNFFAIVDTMANGAAGAALLTSPDGKIWVSITPQLSFMVKNFSDIVYNGSRYYLMGTEGEFGTKGGGSFFSVSTPDILSPGSYGTKGTVAAPPAGSAFSAGVFGYSAGHFVGTAVDSNALGTDYLLYSSDGSHWNDTALGIVGAGFIGVLPASDTFRLLGGSNVQLKVSFGGSPLPLTLLSFDAVAVANAVQLSWRTSNEINTRDFTIERSLDGAHWDSIGRVSANGYTSTTSDYRFLDSRPSPGYDYYQLLLNDHDDKRQASNIKRVWIGQEQNIRTFPNPVKDNLTVELSMAAAGTATLYNTAGIPVVQQRFNSAFFNLPMSGLAGGLYHLVIQLGDKQYQVQVFHQ
jgi:hypothetical protein